MRIIFILILCAHLMQPIAAQAQTAMRNPLSYSLQEYGLMLGIAIFGGLVAWIRKVRAGDYPAWSLGQLVGEMTISAFAGVLCFWACEWAGLPQILTACLTGISGLASSKFLQMAEAWAQKLFERRLGLKSGEGQ